MVTIKLSNNEYKELKKHLITAYEHYEEYGQNKDMEDLQLVLGSVIIHSEED